MRQTKRKNRRTESPRKLELEKVIGLTTTSSSGFASNFVMGDFVYLAGCVVVVYNVDENRQVRFLVTSRTPKALTCVAFSHYCGKLIAAGESGHQPAVLVWDFSTGSCIAELKAHKYGISCVEFSPNGKHLVSVGSPHDGFLCLWDWRSETLVSKIKATVAVSPIVSVCFSSDGNFFLTAGVKHLKQWTIGASAGCRVTAGIGTLAIDCKPVNLGSQKKSSFVSVSSALHFKCSDVTPGHSIELLQPIYALTKAGILCLLHVGVAIKKWVDLKVQQGYGLAVSESHVACACSSGVVRLFMQETLLYAGTLPKPAPYGYHGLADNKGYATFPDAIACSFSASQKLAVIYGDHSLYVWDVHDLSKITSCYTLLSHSDCIWDISMLPSCQELGSIGCSHYAGNAFARGSFVTCSADGSIRLWDITLPFDTKVPHSETTVLHSESDNVFCKDLLGVIYSDKSGELLEKQSESEESVDLDQGFRSLAVSADGLYLAAGDRSGNLCVYNLSTLDLLCFQEAHDAEILTLNFSNVSAKTTAGKGSEGHCLLASGGRDRLIHIYDVERGFDVIETLDDHSASITAVKFACDGSKLLSCSADKSVVFRKLVTTDSGCKSTRYHQEVASRGTVYDMDIEPGHKLAVTVGQDKKTNVLSIDTGKPVRTFKQDGNVGEPIKACVDQSGSYLMCSHADKCMRIYDFTSGELVAQASGHAEVITGARFLNDCKHVVSVGGDSCIFVWKLPAILSKTMWKKSVMNADSCLSCNSSLLKSQPEDATGQDGLCCQVGGDLQDQTKDEFIANDPNIHTGLYGTPQDSGLSESSAFKFSITRLPKWARTKVMDDKVATVRKDEENAETNIFCSAVSRWAEHPGADGYRLFIENKEDRTPPATIRPHHFGARQPFTKEEKSTCSDSTTERSFGLYIGESPASPKGQPRKDTHWRTVHTVFFNEIEFLQEEQSEGNGPPSFTANIEQKCDINPNSDPQVVNTIVDPPTSEMQQTIAKCNIDNARTRRDDLEIVNTNRFFDMQDKEGTAALQYRTPPPRMCDFPKDDVICDNSSTLVCNDNSCFQTLGAPGSNFQNNLQSYYNKMFMTEASSGEDEIDDEFCANKDLFSMHFGTLSTAVKLEKGTASARSSFSTRYFARTSFPVARATLFQTSPRDKTGSITDSSETLCNEDLCIDAASLLATESECFQKFEQQGKAAHEVPIVCDHSMVILPTSEDPTDVQNHVNLHARRYDMGVCGSNTHKLESCNNNIGNQLDNSMLSFLHPSTNVKDSLVALEFEIKDNIQGTPEQQDDEMNQRQESKTEKEILAPSINFHSECEEDLDRDCPQRILAVATVVLNKPSDATQDQSLKTDSTCATSNGSNPNHFPKELQHCFEKSPEDSAVHTGYSIDIDGGESDCSIHRPESPAGRSGREGVIGMPESLEKYKTALRDLSDAAEKALSLFSELGLQDKSNAESISVKFSSDLSDFARRTIPATLEKVQMLCDIACPDRLYESRQNTSCTSRNTEVREKPTFNSDHQSTRSRECASDSLVRSEMILDSVNIEAFVERCTEQLSQTLSSQVLALIQKGLSSK